MDLDALANTVLTSAAGKPARIYSRADLCFILGDFLYGGWRATKDLACSDYLMSAVPRSAIDDVQVESCADGANVLSCSIRANLGRP
jgi:hypothetical protein